MDQTHQKIKEAYAGLKDTIYGINAYLFDNPELSDEEFESSKYLCKVLEDHGFSVTMPYAGLPTAFRAELENGDGPTVGFLAEYDALPGYGPEKKPAHACGHNWIAATCLGAGLVLAKMKDSWSGKVVVFGTPAEETAGRKADMADAGAFDDVDAAFQFHLNATTNLRAQALAMYSAEFEFFGKAAHAAAYPHDGVNALDAVLLTFNAVSFLRQQVTPDVRIHGIITEGGEAPNIIPDHCVCQFYVRAARSDYMMEVMEKVMDCARGAALMTGTELKVNHYENKFDDLNLNKVLINLLERQMAASGFEELDPNDELGGSTDVGNTSYRCPTAYGNVGIADETITCHQEAFVPYVNNDDARKRIDQAVETFVGSAMELYHDPEMVKEARKQFDKSVAK